jgi:hypothetical protein
VWKIVRVDGAMDRIDFNRGDNVEAGLFEAQAKASGPRKQVDSDWSCHPQSPAFNYELTRFWTSCRSDFSQASPEKKASVLRGDLGILSGIAKRSERPIQGCGVPVDCVRPLIDSAPTLVAKTLDGISADGQFGIHGHAKSSR